MSLKTNVKDIFVPRSTNVSTIDGLRGISILSIIMFHCLLGAFNAIRNQTEKLHEFLSNIPVYLHWLLGLDKAVDIFFVVSGFLLATSLFREHESSNRINVRAFYSKRMIRIYPLFLLAMVVYLVLRSGNYIEFLLYNLVFVDNLSPSIKSIISVGWSLAIEMHFYLLLPIIIMVTMNIQHKLLFLSILFLSSIIVRFLVAYLNPELYSTPILSVLQDKESAINYLAEMYWPTYSRYGALVVGVILAYILQFHRCKVEKLILHNTLSINLILIICGVLFFAAFYYPNYTPIPEETFLPKVNFWIMVLHRNVFALSLAAIMLILLAAPQKNKQSWLNGFLSWRVWYPFSKLVFPIYLFHLPVVVFTTFAFYGTKDLGSINLFSLPDLFIIFIIATTVTFVISVIAHLLVEKPVINIGYAKVLNLKQKNIKVNS